MREGGKATCYFCIVETVIPLAVVYAAHFDPHLAGRHKRADDCFFVCRFGLS